MNINISAVVDNTCSLILIVERSTLLVTTAAYIKALTPVARVSVKNNPSEKCRESVGKFLI